MSTAKVQTIQDWPEPKKVKDIQSFLGFANFYRRFISDYSDIVVPLTRLTRQGIAWNFTTEARQSFKALKSASHPPLSLPTGSPTNPSLSRLTPPIMLLAPSSPFKPTLVKFILWLSIPALLQALN